MLKTKLKLLYIEDNFEVEEEIKSTLEMFFDEINFSNNENGLKKVKDRKFDVIITTFDVAKEIRKIDNEILILLLFKSSNENLCFDSIKIGIDGYLLESDINQWKLTLSKIQSNILNKKEYEKNQKLLKKTNSRLEKIIKQSDRQQFTFVKLNEKIALQERELRELYDYDKQQQLIAKKKLESTTVNDLENSTNIIFHPADILSGDFYSIYRLEDSSILAYIIDGQGHGIPPSLTVFAVSSAIQNLIEDNLSFEEIINLLFQRIKNFLGEDEQLTYSFLHIKDDIIKYASGGMYPFLVKHGEEVTKYKANNMPFMNFYRDMPNIKTLSIPKWERILVYTDGLIEDSDKTMKEFAPVNLLKNPEKFKELIPKLETKQFEDDITVMEINRIKVSK